MGVGVGGDAWEVGVRVGGDGRWGLEWEVMKGGGWSGR